MYVKENNYDKLKLGELEGLFNQKFSSLAAWKRFRKLRSLEVWQRFRKSRSLEVWKFRGIKRRLLCDFISTDFIKNLVPYCPSALVPSKAFTMAEILISLTIIGIIAAITLPSLRANINEKTWATQRKALYSRMSQAIAMLPSLNGYGVVMNANGTINYTSTNQKAAMAFVTEGLGKVLKINNICDSTNLSKCGIPSKITPMSGAKINFPTNLTELNPMFTSTYSQSDGAGGYNYYTNPQASINTNAVAFETVNGESVAVFYNPFCQPDMGETGWHYAQPKMCVDFVYDLNNKKGPNKVGKDIGFITALYPIEPNIVSPMPLEKVAKNSNDTQMKQTVAAEACRKQDENSRLPNKDELSAVFYNNKLVGLANFSWFWSGSLASSDMAWAQYFNDGRRVIYRRNSYTLYVRCIKR